MCEIVFGNSRSPRIPLYIYPRSPSTTSCPFSNYLIELGQYKSATGHYSIACPRSNQQNLYDKMEITFCVLRSAPFSSLPQSGKTPDEAVENRGFIRCERGDPIRKCGDRLGGQSAKAVGIVGRRRRPEDKSQPFRLRPPHEEREAVGRGGGRGPPTRSFARLERDFCGQGSLVVLCAGSGRHQEARVQG